ncbi:hypothetical protein [Hymenobacter siberiensis]|jgi:hypothetical protein|uniref:hypothetical protein n=1 Tax=Hymenobacter siberiensis TaxID=2848396 RepID=UPI001C1E7A3C|nr:hypothetical protein [Hymenobacter siberiensis]
MKHILYSILTISALFLLGPASATAAPTRHSLSDTPADVQRKAAAREKQTAAREKVVAAKSAKQASKMQRLAIKSRKVTGKLQRAMLVFLGLEESKAVTSPARLRRQLHSHQKQLKARARMAARAHRHRTHE